MDSFDKKILSSLMDDARITWADLASRVGLSSPAVADRVSRLVKKGIIKGYGTVLDPEKVGLTCTAFIAVTLEKPEHRDAFLSGSWNWTIFRNVIMLLEITIIC
ncbi:Lrp/AsnC family transcriptional regulator [Terrilactibacillus sp. S3-3]|nr:Lrp/AsnC family transcriptional regulator [Terrilactibacillus sp. S3-3]